MIIKPVSVITIRSLHMIGVIFLMRVGILCLVPLIHLDNLPHLDGGHGDAIELVLEAVLDV